MNDDRVKTKSLIYFAVYLSFLTALFMVSVFIGLIPACNTLTNTLTVKSSLRRGNVIAAKSLVAVYRQIYDFIESEEGTYVVCKDLMDKAENEDALEVACEKKIADFEADLDRTLTSTALSLEVFEHAIDTWESIDDNAKLRAIADVLSGLKDLEKLLREAGVDVPVEVAEAISLLQTIQPL